MRIGLYSNMQLRTYKSLVRRTRTSLSKYGFTLIELLVVVSIILILTGGAIAGFAGFGTRQKVKQSGENVKNILRTIQGKAYTGERIVCPTGYALFGWQVNVVSRTYAEVCANANGIPFPQATVVITISPPVTITASNAPIRFRTFPKMAEMPVSSFPICVTDGTNDYQIIVDQSGSIQGETASCP